MTNLKEKQILIPNATGPSNIGDLAILVVLKRLIHDYIQDAKIVIHSTEPHLYKKLGMQTKHTLYSYIAFENRNNIIRIERLTRLLFYYFIFKFHMDNLVSRLFSNDQLFKLCKDYKLSESIVFVGGGYFRTKPALSQNLNLFMHLFMVSFAKLFNNKKIFSPISFGPFAYSWQEKLSARVLNGIDLISARESFSYNKMRKNKIKNVILSSDHALLLNANYAKNKHKKLRIGFTLRKWFKDDRQEVFELEVVSALSKFALKYNYEVLPILQVDSPSFGEDDKSVSDRVSAKLKVNGVKVKSIKKVNSLSSAKNIYSSLDLLLGMRMHSNIIAATQGIPFVAVSYEYKTQGIAKQVDMEKYCIKSENVDKDKLYKLLSSVNKNKRLIKTKLINSIKAIQDNETQRWGTFLAEN